MSLEPRRPRRLARALVAAFALAIAACSGESTSSVVGFDGAPLVVASSSSGALRISVRASPSPLVRGVCAFELSIDDAHGTPVDGLTLTVTPWMSGHGHGTSVTPNVTPQGAGKYLVENVSLYMPGTWTLRTTIAGAPLANEDTAEIAVDVQ
jgi:hypothetical protein